VDVRVHASRHFDFFMDDTRSSSAQRASNFYGFGISR
jgi:hypothetical protein